MKTILLVEDDEGLRRGVSFTFEKEGYQVREASTLAAARAVLENAEVDLVILDLGLPDGPGLVFCEELRRHSPVPILILTARNLETDEVAGLMAGADDYITKPFSLAVLRARVQALLRRRENQSAILKAGACVLDQSACRLTVSGQEIPITATEYRLLQYLMQHAGQVLTRQQLLEALWDDTGNYVDENTLAVNISRLRTKLETDPHHPQQIVTVRGIGYQFAGEE